MQQNSQESMSQAEIDQCIQNCHNCYNACLQTAAKYQQSGKQNEQAVYMRLLLDCADICQVSESFMRRQSERSGYICGICAQICEECANHSDQMGETDCANACRNAAWSCGQMAKMVP